MADEPNEWRETVRDLYDKLHFGSDDDLFIGDSLTAGIIAFIEERHPGFFGSPPAMTQERTMTETTDRLAELAALEPGWDSYGGRPPDPLALRMARTITTRTPTINPSGDGAVLLRWHGDDIEIELWLEPGMTQEIIFVPHYWVQQKTASGEVIWVKVSVKTGVANGC